jgi:hypothetical protein
MPSFALPTLAQPFAKVSSTSRRFRGFGGADHAGIPSSRGSPPPPRRTQTARSTCRGAKAPVMRDIVKGTPVLQT